MGSLSRPIHNFCDYRKENLIHSGQGIIIVFYTSFKNIKHDSGQISIHLTNWRLWKKNFRHYKNIGPTMSGFLWVMIHPVNIFKFSKDPSTIGLPDFVPNNSHSHFQICLKKGVHTECWSTYNAVWYLCKSTMYTSRAEVEVKIIACGCGWSKDGIFCGGHGSVRGCKYHICISFP